MKVVLDLKRSERSRKILVTLNIVAYGILFPFTVAPAWLLAMIAHALHFLPTLVANNLMAMQVESILGKASNGDAEAAAKILTDLKADPRISVAKSNTDN